MASQDFAVHSQDQSIRLRLYSSGSFGAASLTSRVGAANGPEFCVHSVSPASEAPSRHLPSIRCCHLQGCSYAQAAVPVKSTPPAAR